MVVLVQANILTIGLGDKNEVLQELPIRVMSLDSALNAAAFLRNDNFDGVISNWDVQEMENKIFIKKLRAAKPNMPTIVFIRSGDMAQEIAARSLGVSAVLTDQVSDDLFRKTVANVLGLRGFVSIKAISPAKNEKS